MKKLVCLILALLMLGSFAVADELGVQVIGGNNTSPDSVSLDDVQLSMVAEIPDYAEITPTRFEYLDCFMVRKPGITRKDFWFVPNKGNSYISEDGEWYPFNMEVTCIRHAVKDCPWTNDEWLTHYESKTQADYAVLELDILNTTVTSTNFLSECEVKVVFDDNIEYAGWFFQYNYDWEFYQLIDASDNFAIDPYYVGHYLIGCTLPNSVIKSNLPLKMVIKLGENEITYNIRK